MTDKVQKIKEWISKTQDGLMDAQGNFEYQEHEGAYHILCNLDTYIDSLQEEPVSEDLFEASAEYAATGEILANGKEMIDFQKQKAFKACAEWKEGLELSWNDIKVIEKLLGFDNIIESPKEFYQEVLKRFKTMKEK